MSPAVSYATHYMINTTKEIPILANEQMDKEIESEELLQHSQN